jgi:hypothetical protein
MYVRTYVCMCTHVCMYVSLHVCVKPNVIVEWLTLPTREVPGSKLGPEIGYPDYGFRGIPQFLQGHAGLEP